MIEEEFVECHIYPRCFRYCKEKNVTAVYVTISTLNIHTGK